MTEELILAKEKAEENDKLKTAFLHNISHEIRTPMNAIIGFSALLGEPGVDKESQNSYIETITQSSNHLLAIVNDIIEITEKRSATEKSEREQLREKLYGEVTDENNSKESRVVEKPKYVPVKKNQNTVREKNNTDTLKRLHLMIHNK